MRNNRWSRWSFAGLGHGRILHSVAIYFRQNFCLQVKIAKYFRAFETKINLVNFIKFVLVEEIFGIVGIHMKYRMLKKKRNPLEDACLLENCNCC